MCVCVFVCGALVLVCVSDRLYLCAIWDSAYSGTYFFSKLAIVRMCKNVRFKNLNHSLLLSRSHTLRSVCSSLVYLATPYSVYLCAFACVRFCLHVYIYYAMLCYAICDGCVQYQLYTSNVCDAYGMVVCVCVNNLLLSFSLIFSF